MRTRVAAAAQQCTAALARRGAARGAAFAVLGLLTLLLLAARSHRLPPAPRTFVPLASELGAPSCGWRSSAVQPGAPPRDAAALAAALPHAADDDDAAPGADCQPAGACHVVSRSAALFFSVGTLAFSSSVDGHGADQAWALVPACARNLAPVAAAPAAGGGWTLSVPADGWYVWVAATSTAATPRDVRVGDGNIVLCPASPPAAPTPSASPASDPLDCWWLHSGTRAGRLADAGLGEYREDVASWRSADATAGGPGAGDDPSACKGSGCHALMRSQPLWALGPGTLRVRGCGVSSWALLSEQPHVCAVTAPGAQGESCAEVTLPISAAGWFVLVAGTESTAKKALPPMPRLESLAIADGGQLLSSCAADAPAAQAAAVAALPLPRSLGAVAYLVSTANLDELRWSVATVCAAAAWARRYDLLFLAFPEDVAALAAPLAAPGWRTAAHCFRGGGPRLVVLTDPSTAHRAPAAAAALPPTTLASIDAKWAAFAARPTRSRFSVGYRKMVWFWAFGVLAEPALLQYRYLWRLDTDSELLAPLRADLFAQMALRNAALGYHCWTYEAPPVARGFARAARQAAVAAGAMPPAWPGAFGGAGGGGDVSALPQADTPVGMFYNNFMVLDLSFFGFAARPDAARVLAPLLPGVLSHRWGDALAWGMLLGLFSNESLTWHVSDMTYNHGRGYTQILLPNNDERVDWDYASWDATHRGGPRGACTDKRVRWTHRVALKAWRAAHGVF